MKKNLFFAALAAVALASCSNNDVAESIEEAQSPINFEGNTEKMTRAEITSVADLQTPGFAVYGYKYKDGLAWTDWSSTAGNVIFKNVQVSGSSWTYTDTKYWDKTAAYKFYAVAPYEASPNYSISSDGKFTITSVASGLAADSKDYLVDRVVNEEAAAATHNKVSFDFHHIMAKVDFQLVEASTLKDADVLKVSSVKMSGWDNATGTFAQTKVDGTWGELDCSEWTLATPAVAGNSEVMTAETTLTKTAASTNTNTFIMVPQDIDANKLTFTINYTLNDEPFTAQVGVVAAAQKWGTDSHITYTITVGPQAIEFNVSSVCGFCVKGSGAATIN